MSSIPQAIHPRDRYAQKQLDALLEAEGLRRDGNLDYSCGIFDDDEQLIATGSCFRSTLRCLAVSRDHQGEGLLNQVISHLLEQQFSRGNTHVFLYTKPDSAKFMADLGFREIARVEGDLVFMENRRDGFRHWCEKLSAFRREGSSAGIVMNANPFTRGHLHLVEQAARENDTVHLFVLSEEAGPIPFRVRKKLVVEGVGHLPNVLVHDSGPYIISSATFPSYFLKDGDRVIRAQARLDLEVFGAIASALNIRRRYVGQETSSHVTALYNQVMSQELPGMGIQCIEIPRLRAGEQVISASLVRQAIHDGRLEEIAHFLPDSTRRYFLSQESEAVRAAIQAEKNVIHY